MAGRRLMTLDVREPVRRLRAGQKNRAIARELGVARKTVAKYRALAAREGLLRGPLPDVADLDRWLTGMVPESKLPSQLDKAAPYRAVIEEDLGKLTIPLGHRQQSHASADELCSGFDPMPSKHLGDDTSVRRQCPRN